MRYMPKVLKRDLRKITRIGNSQGITLPKEWIQSEWYQLKKEKEKIILEPV